MTSLSSRGVSGGTLSNKARVGDLGKGSPASSELQSPFRLTPIAEVPVEPQGSVATGNINYI
jgi:hypothetical protein